MNALTNNSFSYNGLRKLVLDFFHYQKCGVELECGKWSHPACHTQAATVYGTSVKKDVSGGWHDAGDYGRYIVPAAKAVADLLLAYEMSPQPDTEVPDIAWFEIEWMLKMQDETTGGVYHKVTCAGFDALNEMPQDETEELILSPVSATATAGFAASMALASRFYPQKKEALLAAAHRAWNWCVQNPSFPDFHNPDGVTTGEYGDKNSADERFWAACELYAATGEDSFHQYIKASELSTGLGWENVGTYGLVAYLLCTKETEPLVFSKMKDVLLTRCDELLSLSKKDPYGISLGTRYLWGSNMDVANNAMTLLFGNRLAKNGEYRSAALGHLNYLLGNNSLSQGFITGFGENAPRNPHHRPSVAVGEAVPGMVVGGPDMLLRDDLLKKMCVGQPPERCYIDHKDSYASNEVTIYWNSPVYFVLAVLGE